LPKAAIHRREHHRPEPVRRRQAQQAVELRLRAGRAPLQSERLLFNPLGMAQHGCALVGQHETIRRALEQRLSERLFERNARHFTLENVGNAYALIRDHAAQGKLVVDI
jgi:hypothetical protein